MDEEKVTQTAAERAQQPKPKNRGGQRTQGKAAQSTGQGKAAKPHANNTAHRKNSAPKPKSENQKLNPQA